jgi:hypothetical protein
VYNIFSDMGQGRSKLGAAGWLTSRREEEHKRASRWEGWKQQVQQQVQ